MAAAVRLREDYSADDLWRLACKARHGAQTRRLMALAALVEGQSRAEVAPVGLMDRQTLRDWVIRFNAEGPEGLIDKSSPGRPPKLTPAQRVEEGPGRHDPRLVRWRRADLAGAIKPWIQLASATFDLKAAISSAMVSAGLFHPSVLRGRPFMSRATSLSQA